MPGIYVGKERIDYYSINKLSDMTFNERVGLLDKMDAEPDFTFIVVSNKFRKFDNYTSIQDIIDNGAYAKTVISLYAIVNNIETKLGVYPNGTTLKSISITSVPSKISYKIGDTLDYSGILVKGTYIDGTEKVETFHAEDFSGFNSSTPGTCKVTLTILGREASFDVFISNSITGANFTLTRKIDFLKLKQYSAVIKTTSDIDTVNMTPHIVTGKQIGRAHV